MQWTLPNVRCAYQTVPLHCVTLQQSIIVCYHVHHFNIMIDHHDYHDQMSQVSGGLGAAINGQEEEVLDQKSTDSAPHSSSSAPGVSYTKHQAPSTKHHTPNAMHHAMCNALKTCTIAQHQIKCVMLIFWTKYNLNI